MADKGKGSRNERTSVAQKGDGAKGGKSATTGKTTSNNQSGVGADPKSSSGGTDQKPGNPDRKQP
jgi:hypothetical protein